MKLYAELAQLVDARLRCLRDGDKAEWADKHEDTINALVKQFMPSGSGFDSGTGIDLEKSTGDKLIFTTAYHHMSNADITMGDTVIVTASLAFGFMVRVTGRNRNEVKDYIRNDFDTALNEDCEFALYQRAYSIQVEMMNSTWCCSVQRVTGGRYACCDADRYKAESRLVEYIKNNRDLVVKLP